MNMRTDLALENKEDLSKRGINEDGIRVNVDETVKEMILTQVEITNSQGEKAMGKPIGNYVTLEIKNIPDNMLKISEVLAKEIKKVIMRDPDENFTTLVVGLGNWNITPDALGPKVVSKLMITKHIFKEASELIDHDMSQVCALSPGVLGITGIETSQIIKGVVEKVSPNLIIAIDALASRKIERICSTIQLTDTGIIPGSGVNNKRKALNHSTLGVPVIAIGVPTVVEASTMANDTIDIVLDKIIEQTSSGQEFYKMLSEIDKEEKELMIKDLLRPYVGDLLVTPKDVDQNITDLSSVIANAINLALHPHMNLDQMNSYIH
ncbi:GPR endopeptidase [Alkalibaculum sp. M08DMB]|uniref:Germination protease n=1 Tax=Alkalibaculum sporogenes TaxID=2655001 RepID=A0A6A7K5F8_9FIRM|nr:GPR endopeptidase [Alkalibaculum sporogenes]MPW24630.1 GPR endopeptidase [Alkalibaculum sporogenes]